ncbi:MAG TPA: MFS transporter [Thermomicrobiaceae bacterium]|nr:MFS transporter [Thermomicrobiaceae bacterium]
MREEHARLLMPVYVPTLLLAFGQGLMIPILPIYAKQFGGSYALAGFVVAAAWIGTTLSDLPTGMLLPRMGYRRSMVVGAGLFALATVALGLARVTPELIGFRFVAGVGTSLWGLSRHAYIAQAVPSESRGRAISTFGGINRLGTFAGPAAGGLIGQHFGLGIAMIVAGVLAGVATIIAGIFIHDEVRSVHPAGHRLDFGVLREAVAGNHRDVVAAGAGQIFGQMVRAGRQLVIPLFGSYALGLDPAQVGEIVSASSLIDVLLFMPAGYVMDRWGRKAASVPSFAIMGVGMALVPLATGFWSLLLAVLLVGVGNGMGAGTMMTLGADLAPPGRIGEFLGIWRLIGDSGQAIAPLAVGAVADVIGLSLTAAAVGGLGLIAAAIIGVFVRETRWSQGQRPEAVIGDANLVVPTVPEVHPPPS